MRTILGRLVGAALTASMIFLPVRSSIGQSIDILYKKQQQDRLPHVSFSIKSLIEDVFRDLKNRPPADLKDDYETRENLKASNLKQCKKTLLAWSHNSYTSSGYLSRNNMMTLVQGTNVYEVQSCPEDGSISVPNTELVGKIGLTYRK